MVVAETSYQMLEVSSFCDWKKAFKTSVIKNNGANFFGKKHNGGLSRCIYFIRCAIKLLNPVLESKGVYFMSYFIFFTCIRVSLFY